VDLTSQKLAFEKTDASVLGCGSSAVVYKGMLDNKPVAIKVRKARMPATLAAEVQLKSLLSLQAFKLEGLSQAARSRVRPSIGRPGYPTER
jgi:predicted Ser/Thr protein kinase